MQHLKVHIAYQSLLIRYVSIVDKADSSPPAPPSSTNLHYIINRSLNHIGVELYRLVLADTNLVTAIEQLLSCY